LARSDGSTPASVILLSETGYLMIVKSFTDDLAWQVQRRLIESYFRAARQPERIDYLDPLHLLGVFQALNDQVAELKRTKAEIGSRREATAMNTAAQAVKKAKQLEVALDRSLQYATVKRMELAYAGREFEWRKLKKMAEIMGLPSETVPDVNYGHVKAYHADVWQAAYGLAIPAMEAA
jgi:hypothetical protein